MTPRSWPGFVLLVLGYLVALLVSPFLFAIEIAREGWHADVLPAWRELRSQSVKGPT